MATAIEVPEPATAATPASRPVPVSIAPRPLGDNEFRIVTKLDSLTEGAGCNCQASDDQPY